MPLSAILLLFIAAILHTTWNLLLKQAGEKYMATWWAVLIGSGLFLPFLLFTGLPVRSTWILLFISVCVEVGYYVTLAFAYGDSDFSLLYPMARGTAPAFIALWSILFLGEKLTTGGAIGLGIIILGLVIVGGSNFLEKENRRQAAGLQKHYKSIILAFTLALLISIYSTIDGAAVKQTAAFPYAVMVFFLAPAITSPLVIRRYGWQTLKTELDAHRWRIVAIGILTVSAYLLALAAYSLAPLSYSGAIREVSVVMAAFAGWRFLGEKMGGWRILGAAVIFGGILVIAFMG
jgi:drug/metabolite transporter (DMT)-like permease